MAERTQAYQRQNPCGHPTCNGVMILHDFMGVGADHSDDFNHAEHTARLHQTHLHDAQGSTFGDDQRGVHRLQNRENTMDRSDITMDEDVEVDLELRLGVHHSERRYTSTDRSLVEPVREVHEVPVREVHEVPVGEVHEAPLQEVHEVPVQLRRSVVSKVTKIVFCVFGLFWRVESFLEIHA